MSTHPEFVPEDSSHNDHKRWYDCDPALKRALESLRAAPDKYQAQVALNIIKIVLEHQIETQTGKESDDYKGILDYSSTGNSPTEAERRRRWYDINETLRSAIHLLRDCPDDLQDSVVPTVTRMIEDTLQECVSESSHEG